MELDQDLAKDALCTGVATALVTVDELWITYAAEGGELTLDELLATVVGTAYLTPREYRAIATALTRLAATQGKVVWLPSVDELAVPGDAPAGRPAPPSAVLS